MPERFLLQILRSMVTHGILHSTRGVEGGYTLERPSSDISLLDIVEAVEGPVTSAYIEGLSAPVQSRLNKAMDDINDCLVRELSSIKLSHLIPPQNSEYGPHRYLQN
jgi:Rrf2 family protein